MLDGCYLQHFYSSTVNTLPGGQEFQVVKQEGIGSNWSVTIVANKNDSLGPFERDKDAKPVEMNGWWIVPATSGTSTGEGGASQLGYWVDVAGGDRGVEWRRAGSTGAVVTWGGWMHLGSGLRQPIDIWADRQRFDLRVSSARNTFH